MDETQGESSSTICFLLWPCCLDFLPCLEILCWWLQGYVGAYYTHFSMPFIICIKGISPTRGTQKWLQCLFLRFEEDGLMVLLNGKTIKLAWLQFRLKAPTLHLGKALLSMPGRTCVSKMNKSTKSTVPYSRSSCTQASPPGRANCSASACVLTTCMIGLWWRLTGRPS